MYVESPENTTSRQGFPGCSGCQHFLESIHLSNIDVLYIRVQIKAVFFRIFHLIMATQHPLQKMASPSRGFSLLLHVAGFTSFVASFIYIHQAPLPMDLSKAYGGHFQFLTVLGLGVSTVAFALGIVADITLSPIIFAFKNALAFIATPANVLVAVMYWSIYAYDRRLLMPTDFRLPIIPDMSLHAIPSILLGLDFLLFSPPWKTTTASSLGLAAVLTLIYWAWVERCYSYNGWYGPFLTYAFS